MSVKGLRGRSNGILIKMELMKTLKNHLILFDAECPMCRMYTKTFVDTGLLEAEGRAAYQEVSQERCPMLDRRRAANEIALLNQETGEVTYGVRSLFKVIATGMPVFKPLFEFGPFIWLMTKMYAFVSFNRRVIVPGPLQVAKDQFQPDFRLSYRIAYLVFTWLATAYILSGYSRLLTGILPAGDPDREYLICGGQMVFQGIIILMIERDKVWMYLGNMMTISFAGALMLLPPLILSGWLSMAPVFYALWFMGVAGLMFLEHIRRSRLLLLGWTLSISWVIYRLGVLLLVTEMI